MKAADGVSELAIGADRGADMPEIKPKVITCAAISHR
jgi:hypothetical protein